jgi:prepilin-type N-terminal cleavage/methylation domain-containing protein
VLSGHGRRDDGFTLTELLIVALVIAILAATAVPSIASALRLYRLNSSAQTVAAAVRSARYTAVSKNRTVRVRFNCPAANQFRMVEVLGNATDAAANRCSEVAFPFPDANPAATPNLDGPVTTLNQDSQFIGFQDLQIDTTGRVTALVGCPACAAGAAPAIITIGNGFQTRTLTVTTNGQIQLP